MIKNLYFILVSIIGIGSIILVSYPSESRSSGAPVGRTNAPNETTCTSCHSGVLNSGPETFLVSIAGNPVSYVPGQSYTISVDFPVSGRTKHGFMIVALNQNNQNAGTFSTNASTSIQSLMGSGTLADRNYITHTSAGNEQKLWTINWVAPSTPVGNIRFFAAGNASNALNNSSGDNIYNDTLELLAPTKNTVSVFANHTINVFPNPATDKCFVGFDLLKSGFVSIDLINSLGQIVLQKPEMPLFAGPQNQELLLSNIASGHYFIRIQSAGSSFAKPLHIR